jgi:hypothetical protein
MSDLPDVDSEVFDVFGTMVDEVSGLRAAIREAPALAWLVLRSLPEPEISLGHRVRV